MRYLLTLALAASCQAQTFDVKQHGALCDGATDDTLAIQATIDAAFASPTMAKVYFPGGGMCKVTILRWPDSGQRGWFVTNFDTGIIANHIYLGNFNAFIGHTSFFSFNTMFPQAPRASWIQVDHLKEPFVEIAGKSNIFIEGIHIQGMSIGAAGLYIHDNAGVGSTNIYLRDSSVGGRASTSGQSPAIKMDASGPTVVSGFSFTAENCNISATDPTVYSLDATNYGMITIRGGYLGSIHYVNKGVPSGGDVSIEDVLSESLTHDFFFSEASPGIVSDITLKRIKIADFAAGVYMLKAVTTANQLTNVKIEMSQSGATSSGLVDPLSTPTHLGLICEGAGCQDARIYPSLYFGQLTGPRGPTVFYGSKYQPNPMQVVTTP